MIARNVNRLRVKPGVTIWAVGLLALFTSNVVTAQESPNDPVNNPVNNPMELMDALSAHAAEHGAARPILSPWHGRIAGEGIENPDIDVMTFQKAGYKVIPWTVNEINRMIELVEFGIDGIITDYPNRLNFISKRIDAFETVDRQGHRGARGLRPENTLPAMEAALDERVTTLELDLAVTKDGVAVLSHNPAVESSICNGVEEEAPAIHSLTLAELRRNYTCDKTEWGPEQVALPIESPVSFAFARKKGWSSTYIIPSLKEAYDFIAFYQTYRQRQTERWLRGSWHGVHTASRVRFNVETKITSEWEEKSLTPDAETFARIVADTIRAAGMADRTTIQSFDARTLLEVHKYAPEIQTVMLVGGRK